MSKNLNTKKKMYEALLNDELGNTVKAWKTLSEMLDSGWEGTFGLRAKKISDPIRKYNIMWDQKEKVLGELSNKDYNIEDDFIYCASPPDEERVIQGEVSVEPKGLYFYYSYYPAPMREALEKDGQHAWGLKALNLLKLYLDPCDLDHLMLLFVNYPGHVIEFTTYRIYVNHSRTVIWEVRNY